MNDEHGNAGTESSCPKDQHQKKNPTCESGGKNTVTPGAIFYPSAKHDPRKKLLLPSKTLLKYA